MYPTRKRDRALRRLPIPRFSPVSRLRTVRSVCELSKIFMYAASVSCGGKRRERFQ